MYKNISLDGLQIYESMHHDKKFSRLLTLFISILFKVTFSVEVIKVIFILVESKLYIVGREYSFIGVHLGLLCLHPGHFTLDSRVA